MYAFAKNTTSVLTTNLLNTTLSIITSIIIARVLGPEKNGIYSLTILLPSLVLTFFSFGLGTSTLFHIANKKYELPTILGNNIILCLIFSTTGVLFGFIFIEFFKDHFFTSVKPTLLYLGLFLFPLNMAYSFFISILNGLQNFKAYNYYSIFRSFSFFLFLIFLCLLTKPEPTTIIQANIFLIFIINSIMFFKTKKIAKGITISLSLKYIKNLCGFGAKIHISNVIAFLNYRTDIFLISMYLNPKAVGYYIISVLFAEKLWLISSAASMVLLPKVASSKHSLYKDPFTPFVARTVLWSTFVIAIFIFFIADQLIMALFTVKYQPSVSPLKILLPGVVLISGSRVLSNDIAGRGFPILNSYIATICFITNLILNILFIPKYNISGAAFASTVSYTFTSILRIILYCKLSGNSWKKLILLNFDDIRFYTQEISTIISVTKARLYKVTSSG